MTRDAPESKEVNNREWMDRMCRSEATTRCFPSPGLPEVSYSRSVKEVIQPQVPLRLPCYDFAPTFLRFGTGSLSRVPDFTRWQLETGVALVAGLNPTSHDTS